MADFYTDFSGAAGTDLRDMGFINLMPYGDPESYKYLLDGNGHAYGMPIGMAHSQSKFTDTIQTATIFRKDDLADNRLSISARVVDDLFKYSCVLVTIDSSRITLQTDYSTMGFYDRLLAVGGTEAITLRSEGNSFSVYRNGVLIIGPTTITKYAVGYAAFGTLSGVWDKQDNGLLFDSYEFTDLSAPPVGPDVKTYTYAGGELMPVTVKLWQSDGTNWTQRNAKLWASDGSAWADKGTI